jgi:hypothetical protein
MPDAGQVLLRALYLDTASAGEPISAFEDEGFSPGGELAPMAY